MVNSDEGRKARGVAVSHGRQAGTQRDLDELGRTDKDWDLLAPKVARLSLKQIMAATGLAISHSSAIKRGERRPHPRHWQALETAVDSLAVRD